MTILALMLAAGVAAEQPARAERCLAHINAMIAEEARATGRVAGPSWFIRDWWTARLPEEGAGALSEEQRQALVASIEAMREAEPERYRAELTSCTGEAIEGGALP